MFKDIHVFLPTAYRRSRKHRTSPVFAIVCAQTLENRQLLTVQIVGTNLSQDIAEKAPPLESEGLPGMDDFAEIIRDLGEIGDVQRLLDLMKDGGLNALGPHVAGEQKALWETLPAVGEGHTDWGSEDPFGYTNLFPHREGPDRRHPDLPGDESNSGGSGNGYDRRGWVMGDSGSGHNSDDPYQGWTVSHYSTDSAHYTFIRDGEGNVRKASRATDGDGYVHIVEVTRDENGNETQYQNTYVDHETGAWVSEKWKPGDEEPEVEGGDNWEEDVDTPLPDERLGLGTSGSEGPGTGPSKWKEAFGGGLGADGREYPGHQAYLRWDPLKPTTLEDKVTQPGVEHSDYKPQLNRFDRRPVVNPLP